MTIKIKNEGLMMRAMLILGYGFWYFLFVFVLYQLISLILGEYFGLLFVIVAIYYFYHWFFKKDDDSDNAL